MVSFRPLRIELWDPLNNPIIIWCHVDCCQRVTGPWPLAWLAAACPAASAAFTSKLGGGWGLVLAYSYHGPTKPIFLHVFMVNNLVFWVAQSLYFSWLKGGSWVCVHTHILFKVSLLAKIPNNWNNLEKITFLLKRRIVFWKTFIVRVSYVPWSKVAILGMVIPPLIGILIMGI